MKLPKIIGLIDRRILINYKVDADVLASYLPQPFKPQLVNGKAIAGICLIRLKQIRPKGFPAFMGISSENAAHRIAVEWEENGLLKTGVYIPRRDTSSRLNAWAGGTIFPGVHALAKFNVVESDGQYELSLKSSDQTSISVKAVKTENWNDSSVFKNLQEASLFFEKGSVGFSPHKESFDGLKLIVDDWQVQALEMLEVQSSFFEDRKIFPQGSVQFDNALLMNKLNHSWQALGQMKSP